jgi:hypothetical protein
MTAEATLEGPSAFSGLEDLVDICSGNQIDMRPTLLRVLTDLYLQRTAHRPEDERYYTELTLRLIDATNVTARIALAERLASYPAAPRAVVARLARDEIKVAAPILERSRCLTSSDLDAIALERGAEHAELIAKRRRMAVPPLPPADREQGPHDHVAAAEAYELAELFYAAGPGERRLILISLDYALIAPLAPAACMQRADTWRLEAAALKHNTETIVRELERTMGISRSQARRIIGDESGEPIVVAAKAMDLPADVVQRLLLFMNPRIGQSVDRVHALSFLYGEISITAARRLTALWREADRDARPGVQHHSVAWRAAAENARRALSEVSRRSALSQERLLRSGNRREHPGSTGLESA